MENKTLLSLWPLFVHCPTVCWLLSLTEGGGHGVGMLELRTPVQMTVLVLVIVCLSPNTVSFIPTQGSGPFTGHL